MKFILRHLNKGENHMFSEVLVDNSDKMTRTILVPPFEGIHTVIGFCEGTLLLDYVNGDVVVWNYFFDQFKILPPPPTLKSPPCSYSHCDGTCRVEVSSLVSGIGFVPDSGDYKVLRITSNYYYHPREENGRVCLKQAQVYSVINNCWEEIEIDSDEYYKYEVIGCLCPIYIRGFCYWMAEMVDGGRIITSFSFITQKFSSFDVPPIILDENFEYEYQYEYDLVEIEGRLGIVVYPNYGNVKRFCFLVFRGGSWARKTEYDVRLVGARRFLGLSYDHMLLLEGRDGELLVYSYKKKVLNRIYQIYDYPLEMSVFPCVEMIRPLPDGNIAAFPSTLDCQFSG